MSSKIKSSNAETNTEKEYQKLLDEDAKLIQH